MTISPLRRHARITALLAIVAATQLVFAPALRLCGDSHRGAAHHARTSHHGHQMPSHDETQRGDDQCLLMRGCEAIAIALPTIAGAEPTAHMPWPTTDLERLQSVDRAPEAPPPRA